MKRRLSLEEGLSILNEGIAKAMMILDGYPTSALFTCEEYMKLYDESLGRYQSGMAKGLRDAFEPKARRPGCVYDMCVQSPSREYCSELYGLFKKALEESITTKVMPALRDKTHVFLLNELCNMWAKYKVMAKCLGGFFLYLDRHFAKERKTASLNDLSISCFRDLVCVELYPFVMEATISLINQDREENSVCRDLLKNVSTFFVEIGNGKMDYYENFETTLLSSTAHYYNQLLRDWLLHCSPFDILMQAQNSLSQEKQRASQILHQSSVEKMLQVVHEQLLGETAFCQAKLQEKQKAECADGSIPYQEVLLGCAGLNLGEERSPM